MRRTGRGAAPGRIAGALLIGCLAACAAEAGPDQVVVVDGTPPPTTTTTTLVVVDPGPPSTLGIVLGPPTLTVSSSVSTAGLDGVTFGMPIREAEQTAGTAMLAIVGDPTGDCWLAQPEEGPPGLTFLVRDGRVERLDIDEAGVTTRSGAGVGTTATEIVGLFGNQIQRADNPGGGERLTFVPTDPNDRDYRIIFETTDDVVVRFRAGRLPDVETGCGD